MKRENIAESSYPILEQAGLVARPRVEEAHELDDEDVAAYLFDLMVAARKLAISRGHSFLGFLLGMAAEEAASHLAPGADQKRA
ncbi:MAG: hypothetical protein GC184_11355 [Rhizobiales bacterium]|nr:hypothetical protein [Hyphomicrobiales bacterium]